MKILHLIDDLSMGGAQNLLKDLSSMQKDRGDDVVVLQLKIEKDEVISKELIDRGVRVCFLSKKCSMYNPINIFKIVPYIRKFDIVHVHLFPALYWAGFAKLISLSKTPMVYTEHSTFNRRRRYRLLRMVDAFVYKFAYKEIIACSNITLKAFKNSYPNICSISIPNGIAINKYIEAKPYTKIDLCGIAESDFIVTMIARFAFPKRQDTIVKAIALLPKQFHAVFVGGEPTNEGVKSIQELATELHLDSRVHFLYIRSDVPRILKSSDVVVMSSEYEGLSLSSIEGMASGKPFVSTDVDGLREVVSGAGELFECGNEEQLASILLHLYNDKLYYDRIVNRCLDRAAKYDISEMVDKYQEEYERYIH